MRMNGLDHLAPHPCESGSHNLAAPFNLPVCPLENFSVEKAPAVNRSGVIYWLGRDQLMKRKPVGLFAPSALLRRMESAQAVSAELVNLAVRDLSAAATDLFQGGLRAAHAPAPPTPAALSCLAALGRTKSGDRSVARCRRGKGRKSRPLSSLPRQGEKKNVARAIRFMDAHSL
jgi:hypothetical protein